MMCTLTKDFFLGNLSNKIKNTQNSIDALHSLLKTKKRLSRPIFFDLQCNQKKYIKKKLNLSINDLNLINDRQV